MSGGVDSSAVAKIIKDEGYECIGATMKLSGKYAQDTKCLSQDDIADAKRVCEALKIEHRVVDFSSDFEKYVIAGFVSAYENGATPNPCVDCNCHLKFDKLLFYAEGIGCDSIATGHYAKIEYSEKYERLVLKKGRDAKKDQSYFLYRLKKESLGKIIFPLGDTDGKEKTRELVRELGIDISEKKESQDICFVPNGDYASFIEQYTKKEYPVGDFVRFDGKYLGKHKGIIRYTVGQRKGLGLALDRSMYVIEKDLVNNRVIIGDPEHLMARELYARDVNLIACDDMPEPIKVKAKIRYNQTEKDAVAQMINGRLHVKFDEPQRAISKGQSVVLYDGDTVIGGGIIDEVARG